MITLKSLIEYQKKCRISDLHFIESEVPLARNHAGKIVPLSDDIVDSELIQSFLDEVCTEEEQKIFHEMNNLDLAKSLFNQGRFRINIFKEIRGIGMNIRIIPDMVMDMESLSIPLKVLEQVRKHTGLILISGPNNSGKTTLMNGFINVINEEENYD